MNPFGVFALALAIVVGYFALSGAGFHVLNTGTGPVATGPDSGSQIQNPQPISNRGGFFGIGGSGYSNNPPTRNTPPPRPGESPFGEKIHISTVQRWSSLPEEEYIAIRYDSGFYGSGSSQERIDVTGWSIASSRTSAKIPLAFNIPEIDASEQDLFLPPGGEVVVVTGSPNYTSNFRENACTAYLAETKTFSPSLSYSCLDEARDRSTLLSRKFNGACIDAIQSVSSCRQPHGSFQAGVVGADCIEYMVQHLSYAGCVADYRDRKDFLKNTWHVSLKQPRKIFDSAHDRVKLYDRAGLLVDEFEY